MGDLSGMLSAWATWEPATDAWSGIFPIDVMLGITSLILMLLDFR